MAKWLKFSKAFDYRWPNGSVTAFPEGAKVHVKDEVAVAAKKAGVASDTEKPADDDADKLTSQSSFESKRDRLHNRQARGPAFVQPRRKRKPGTPVATNASEEVEADPLPALGTEAESGVSGAALSAAGGGAQPEQTDPPTGTAQGLTPVE